MEREEAGRLELQRMVSGEDLCKDKKGNKKKDQGETPRMSDGVSTPLQLLQMFKYLSTC